MNFNSTFLLSSFVLWLWLWRWEIRKLPSQHPPASSTEFLTQALGSHGSFTNGSPLKPSSKTAPETTQFVIIDNPEHKLGHSAVVSLFARFVCDKFVSLNHCSTFRLPFRLPFSTAMEFNIIFFLICHRERKKEKSLDKDFFLLFSVTTQFKVFHGSGPEMVQRSSIHCALLSQSHLPTLYSHFRVLFIHESTEICPNLEFLTWNLFSDVFVHYFL